jgi:hypothetical protein
MPKGREGQEGGREGGRAGRQENKMSPAGQGGREGGRGRTYLLHLMLEVASLLWPGVVSGGPHAKGEGDGREVHDRAVVFGQNFIADVEVEEEEGGGLDDVVGDTEEGD